MKSKELSEKSVEELTELAKTRASELFQARLQNFTNQLDDTSTITKARKDVARIQGELRRRELDSLAAEIQAQLAAAGSEAKAEG
jgi:large subunit ribosomal protein L29